MDICNTLNKHLYITSHRIIFFRLIVVLDKLIRYKNVKLFTYPNSDKSYNFVYEVFALINTSLFYIIQYCNDKGLTYNLLLTYQPIKLI